MIREVDTDLVLAARDGGKAALETLVTAYLPLVHNIIGRALPGDLDVEDAVQETMLNVVRGLPELREPEAFRSWLVAIAMNQIRKHHRQRQLDLQLLEEFEGLPDLGSDFTDLAVWEMSLAEQRVETSEASAWLDDDDRKLLSLWRLVEADRMSRAEMVAKLGLNAHLVTVRIGRMKTQLETARGIVRALAATPRCPGLTAATAAWTGGPAPLWRKRIARHVRECDYCTSTAKDLVPAEYLLVDGPAGSLMPSAEQAEYAGVRTQRTPNTVMAAVLTGCDAIVR
jgi:RNA polymerase sigma factor (sigma-70 family)